MIYWIIPQGKFSYLGCQKCQKLEPAAIYIGRQNNLEGKTGALGNPNQLTNNLLNKAVKYT